MKNHGNRTHGKSYTKMYRVWQGMVDRCHNPNNTDYYLYGGRGISVCKEWRIFENFYEDMGDRPTKDHRLDRINNEGGYCKENCKGSTHAEQGRNKRTNRVFTLNGVSKCMQDWAKQLQISPSTIHARASKGWSIEKILSPNLRTLHRSE